MSYATFYMYEPAVQETITITSKELSDPAAEYQPLSIIQGFKIRNNIPAPRTAGQDSISGLPSNLEIPEIVQARLSTNMEAPCDSWYGSADAFQDSGLIIRD